MRKVIEVQGVDVAVVIRRVHFRDQPYMVSVYSANGRVPDYSDELYSEPAMNKSSAFSVLNRLTSALKKGRFPWEVEDE